VVHNRQLRPRLAAGQARIDQLRYPRSQEGQIRLPDDPVLALGARSQVHRLSYSEVVVRGDNKIRLRTERVGSERWKVSRDLNGGCRRGSAGSMGILRQVGSLGHEALGGLLEPELGGHLLVRG